MEYSMDRKKTALLTLLLDDDHKIAIQAMEKLLEYNHDLDDFIKENQDTNNPRIRRRIHQMGSILNRRRRKDDFLESVATGGCSLLDGMIQLSLLNNPKLAEATVRKRFHQLAVKFSKLEPSSENLIEFMREENFFVPETFCLETDLLLLDTVLQYRLGSAITLCAIAKSLGDAFDWPTEIVVYEGLFCLLDQEKNLINPTFSWKLTPIDSVSRSFPCKNSDVWNNLLSQLFLGALQDGNMQGIHLFGSLMTTLSNSDIEKLPYPVGEDQRR